MTVADILDEAFRRRKTADTVRRLAHRNVAGPGGNSRSLTNREREIVTLVARGYRNRDMAHRMFISEQTVKNHLHNVFEKLGVSSRLELALYAVYYKLHLGN